MNRLELEGLAKPVAQPYVTTFADCFGNARPWSQRPEENHQLLLNKVGELTITPLCSITGKQPYRSLSVIPADWIYSRIREHTINIDDRMWFEVIDHGNGFALVIAQHNKIIGSVWLAYIRSDTIPKSDKP